MKPKSATFKVIQILLAIGISSNLMAAALLMEIRGTFSVQSGNGHPDFTIGDTFIYTITFDDSQTTSSGNFFGVTSVVSNNLLINGIEHTVFAPETVSMNGDIPIPGLPAVLQLTPSEFSTGVNRVYVGPTRLASYPSPVGTIPDFLDFFAFNGHISNSLPASTPTPFGISGTTQTDGLSGAAAFTVQAIPEPSSALLLLSGSALCLRRRRGANAQICALGNHVQVRHKFVNNSPRLAAQI